MKPLLMFGVASTFLRAAICIIKPKAYQVLSCCAFKNHQNFEMQYFWSIRTKDYNNCASCHTELVYLAECHDITLFIQVAGWRRLLASCVLQRPISNSMQRDMCSTSNSFMRIKPIFELLVELMDVRRVTPILEHFPIMFTISIIKVLKQYAVFNQKGVGQI